MSPDFVKSLKTILITHEGFRQIPYTDTTGHLTIGIGRNLTDRGISYSESMILLENDIEYFSKKLEKEIIFYNDLDDVRKIVLVDMCFNLGFYGFMKFKNFLEAVKNKNWDLAALEILRSKAYGQAPKRYQQLAQMMKSGEMPNDEGDLNTTLSSYRDRSTLNS